MAQHMAQQNAEGSRDLSTLVDASAELQHLVQTVWRLRQPDGLPAGSDIGSYLFLVKHCFFSFAFLMNQL